MFLSYTNVVITERRINFKNGLRRYFVGEESAFNVFVKLGSGKFRQKNSI